MSSPAGVKGVEAGRERAENPRFGEMAFDEAAPAGTKPVAQRPVVGQLEDGGGKGTAIVRRHAQKGAARRLELGQRAARPCRGDERASDRHDVVDLGRHRELGAELLQRVMKQLQLSARAYHRILKLARTIADLADESQVQAAHIAEAVRLREFDRPA